MQFEEVFSCFSPGPYVSQIGVTLDGQSKFSEGFKDDNQNGKWPQNNES